MKARARILVLVAAAGLAIAGPVLAQSGPGPEGTVPGFKIGTGELALRRHAQPQTPFDKVGRRFALLGFEGGGFEAWAYPLNR